LIPPDAAGAVRKKNLAKLEPFLTVGDAPKPAAK
jgi:hypothetical protein